jgi:thiosulfate dehydrogenase [quinone] large subunit
MLSLLFSSNYPGAHAPLWQYFGASLDHLVLALCFVVFLIADSTATWSWQSLRSRQSR